MAAVAAVEAAVRQVAGRLASASGWTALAGHLIRKRHFGESAVAQLADAIREAELGHDGELMVVLETRLPLSHIDSRARALEVFGRECVWDTPARTGVLLYVALGDHRIELVADRGIAASGDTWQQICADLQRAWGGGTYLPGLLTAIRSIEDTLRAALPAVQTQDDRNRIADATVFL